MSHADVIVDVAFLQYGKHAPSNSGFKGIVDTKSLFGGYTSYTSRDEATKSSVVSTDAEGETDKEKLKIGSYADYTSRENATKRSSQGDYFTMTNEGAIYTDEERMKWINKSKSSFAKPGDLAWTVVVSLDNYDLLSEYGLKDQHDFARLTKNCLIRSFQKMHLDAKNMIWWEDYHTNTDHPHMHITFLEKEHTRDRGKFTAKEIDALKRTFISQIAARKIYNQTYGRNADDDLQKITPMRQDIQKLTAQLDYKTIDGLLSLYSQLPKTGRLQYNSVHMIPFRDQLDNIVEQILNNEAIQPVYKDFKSMLMHLDDAVNTAGNETISHLYETEDKKLRVQIANSILHEYKKSDVLHAVCNTNTKWKEAHATDVYKKSLHELQKKNDLGDIQKVVIDALLHDKIDDAKSLLSNLGSTEVDDFIKATCDLLGNDKQSGMIKLAEAEQKGSKAAKHCRNYHKMPLSIPKRVYHTVRNTISPALIHVTSMHLHSNMHDVSSQIAAFAHNSSHISATSHRDDGAEEMARETERIRDREDRERSNTQ